MHDDDTKAGDQAAGDQAAGDRAAAGEHAVAGRAVLIMLRVFRALELLDAGLTPQQYRILKLAGAGGERSAKLAERLAVAKPTLTATADGLVAAGYARREAEAGDRRVVRLCLTASGHEAIQHADAAYGRWWEALLAETSDSDGVMAALDVLNRALDGLKRSRPAPPGHEPDQALSGDQAAAPVIGTKTSRSAGAARSARRPAGRGPA